MKKITGLIAISLVVCTSCLIFVKADYAKTKSKVLGIGQSFTTSKSNSSNTWHGKDTIVVNMFPEGEGAFDSNKWSVAANKKGFLGIYNKIIESSPTELVGMINTNNIFVNAGKGHYTFTFKCHSTLGQMSYKTYSTN